MTDLPMEVIELTVVIGGVGCVLTIALRVMLFCVKAWSETDGITIDLDKLYNQLNDSLSRLQGQQEKPKRKNDESDDEEEYVSFEDLLEKPKRKNNDGLSGWGVYVVRRSRHPFATIADVDTAVLIEGVSRDEACAVFGSETDQYDGIVTGDAAGVCWKYFWDAGDLCRVELRPVAGEGEGHLGTWEAPADSRKRKNGNHE